MRSSIIFMKWARSPQNENKVPFQEILPLRLRNRVTGKGTRTLEAGCLQEITLVLSCLVKNNYEDRMCTKETENFQNCYKTYLKNRNFSKEQALTGVLTPGSKNLKFGQINKLLAMFPHK
ncbi:uncharacterized protein [Fopius arisanus]|uniref:Chchd1_1 protein n=1 Tax=Fopius arisanus TaxID=64838 RepID=A0A0C9R2Y2_9HYME|nr:PREDICTED: uncharacterized protein LOC105269787 [Fopius arisanus]